MKRIGCTFDLVKRRGNLEGQATLGGQVKGLEIMIIGRVIIRGRINDLKIMEEEIRKDHRRCAQQWSGTFLVLAWDKINDRLNVYQDVWGGLLPIYHTRKGDTLYIDTSLKHLLARSGLRPGMDEEAAARFVDHGVVTGRRTLLQGVEKLAPFCALMVGKEPVQCHLAYQIQRLSPAQAKGQWEKVLKENILSCAGDGEELYIPLSSGYDSNYVLYALHEGTKKPITAFTLGADKGVNEIRVVEKNIECYERASLVGGRIGQEGLAWIQDMVWQLDGAVYEVGVFLQYQLARLMEEKGAAFAICGEGADQAMHQDLGLNLEVQLDETGIPVNREPYIYGSYIVLKKSALLLNSFGVEGMYPYLGLDLLTLCRALTSVNRRGKKYHKRVCQRSFPRPVLRRMSKVGGSTSLQALFRDGKEIEDFFALVESHPRFGMYEEKLRAGGRREGRLKRIGSSILAEPNPARLISKCLSRMKVGNREYYTKQFRQREARLNRYMRLYFLTEFERLYVKDFRSHLAGSHLPPERPGEQTGL